MKWVYVVTSSEPDAEVDSVWESQKEADEKRAQLHSRWPGMGYLVLTVPFHKKADS